MVLYFNLLLLSQMEPWKRRFRFMQMMLLCHGIGAKILLQILMDADNITVYSDITLCN